MSVLSVGGGAARGLGRGEAAVWVGNGRKRKEETFDETFIY
jgi:hypothetical protein